jgi:hypothetical protein
LKSKGIQGLFYGYKKAFRLSNFVTKSLFRVQAITDDHVVVQEYQRSSGKYDADLRPSEERSEGYGFSKSDKLWFFLREHDFEQPRIFCFSEFKDSLVSSDSKTQHTKNSEVITSLFGHCLESSRKFKDDVFYSKAMLTRLSDDIGDDATFWETYAASLDLYPIPEKIEYEIDDPHRVPVHPSVLRFLRV